MGTDGVFGVDIGGSGVRVARVETDQTLHLTSRHLRNRSVATVVDTVVELIGERLPTAVGVAVPGFVQNGVVLASPNFPAFTGVPLASILTTRLSCPVTIENDATCAALGVSGAANRVVLTLGTGVGGGVIVDGRPLPGRHAGELGHLDVGGSNPCGCGAIGCLEASCSVSALLRQANARGLPPDLDALIVDPRARPIWQEAGRALCSAVRSLLNTFGPDELHLLGGMTRARHLLQPGAESGREQAIAPHRATPIVWGGRADESAVRGAAGLCERHGAAQVPSS